MYICSNINCIYIGWQGVLLGLIILAVYLGAIWLMAIANDRMDRNRRELLDKIYNKPKEIDNE